MMSVPESTPEGDIVEHEPHLPPDVERLIFLMAFDAIDHKTNITISLVAKRVREWIRPLIYRVIDQMGEHPTPDFNVDGCPGIEEIGRFAHHLVLGRVQQTEEEVNLLLPHCPNLRSITCWVSLLIKPFIPTLATMENLRILSGNTTGVTEDDLDTPLFLRLTHLELICDMKNEEILYIFPPYIQKSQLTHLRLYNMEAWDIDPIDTILRTCPQLRVVILTEPCYDDRESPVEFHTMHEKDPRLVNLDSELCNTRDWLSSARGFYDSWVYAEQIVTARQKNYFKEGEFQNLPFTSHFDWDANLNDKGKEWYSEEKKTHIYPLRPLSPSTPLSTDSEEE